MSDVELAYAVGQTLEVTAIDVAQGGWCVARPEGLPVLFVRHALPGERVLARVTEVTSRFARADAIEVREASPDRVEAPCPNAHPGGCGGCDWQHASLPAQRALKARRHRPAAPPGGRARARRRDHRRGAEGRRGHGRPARRDDRGGHDQRGGPAGSRLAHPGPVRGPPGRPGRPARAPLARGRRHRGLPDRAPRHPRSWPARLLLGGRGHGRGRGRQPGTRPPGPRGHPDQGGPRAAWPPSPRFRARPPGRAR